VGCRIVNILIFEKGRERDPLWTVITFQGTTVDEIETSFRDSVDDYLDWCKERNKEPEKPFSGKFVLRLSPDLHRKLNLKAKMTNTSLNSFIVQTLEKAAVS